MKVPRRSAGGGYDIPMTPMIDVVFLLLVYFVWTASFQMAELRLPGAVSISASTGTAASAAPQEPPPPAADFDQVVIRVRWQDAAARWQINDQVVTNLAAVRETLVRIATIKADVPVVLHPDAVVPFGHVIDAYDVARQAGFSRVRFAASPTGSRT